MLQNEAFPGCLLAVYSESVLGDTVSVSVMQVGDEELTLIPLVTWTD